MLWILLSTMSQLASPTLAGRGHRLDGGLSPPNVNITFIQPGPKNLRALTAIDCNEKVNLGPGDLFEITSPGWPNNYKSNQRCYHDFAVAAKTEVVIKCPKFYTLGNPAAGCAPDYLKITYGRSRSMKFCRAQLQGYQVSARPRSNDYTMWIDFYSDARDTAIGFRCTVTGQGTVPVTPAPTPAPSPSTSPAPGTGGSCPCGLANTPSRIVNGEESQQNEFPWQVAMVQPGNKVPFCGGTIINRRFVMTAAHCTDNKRINNMNVVVGEHSIATNIDKAKIIKVKSVNAHPLYNLKTTQYNYDYSILELAEDLVWSDQVKPACLPKDTTMDYAGQTAIVSGWGVLYSNGPRPAKLNYIQVTVSKNIDCGAYASSQITDLMMCAAAKGKDSCQADSGGPLVSKADDGRYYLIGVVSWGMGCALPDYPGVYSRVTSVLPWIKSTISSGSTCNA